MKITTRSHGDIHLNKSGIAVWSVYVENDMVILEVNSVKYSLLEHYPLSFKDTFFQRRELDQLENYDKTFHHYLYPNFRNVTELECEITSLKIQIDKIKTRLQKSHGLYETRFISYVSKRL